MTAAAPLADLVAADRSVRLLVRMTAPEAEILSAVAAANGTNRAALARVLLRDALRSLPTPQEQ